jgi:hypothetical protein
MAYEPKSSHPSDQRSAMLKLLIRARVCFRGGLPWRGSFVPARLYQSRASIALHTSPRMLARSVNSGSFGGGGFRAALIVPASASSCCSPMRSLGDIGPPAGVEAAAPLAYRKSPEVPRCGRERARRANCRPLGQRSGLLFSRGSAGPFFLE